MVTAADSDRDTLDAAWREREHLAAAMQPQPSERERRYRSLLERLRDGIYVFTPEVMQRLISEALAD